MEFLSTGGRRNRLVHCSGDSKKLELRRYQKKVWQDLGHLLMAACEKITEVQSWRDKPFQTKMGSGNQGGDTQ